ncbi:MAG: hypothetical protein CMB64_03205 [Euryarchaeota archaeon]|nr:hypothetical protein [Euryarchaeota archaeon]
MKRFFTKHITKILIFLLVCSTVTLAILYTKTKNFKKILRDELEDLKEDFDAEERSKHQFRNRVDLLLGRIDSMDERANEREKTYEGAILLLAAAFQIPQYGDEYYGGELITALKSDVRHCNRTDHQDKEWQDKYCKKCAEGYSIRKRTAYTKIPCT